LPRGNPPGISQLTPAAQDNGRPPFFTMFTRLPGHPDREGRRLAASPRI
jgi:hypothetical protein